VPLVPRDVIRSVNSVNIFTINSAGVAGGLT
jgi:hypothetical protein